MPNKLYCQTEHISLKKTSSSRYVQFHRTLNCIKTSKYSKSIIQMAQKVARFLYALILPNINQFSKWFSKLFHSQSQENICNNTLTKNPITPQVCRYTTLRNVSVLKVNNIIENIGQWRRRDLDRGYTIAQAFRHTFTWNFCYHSVNVCVNTSCKNT